MERVPSKNLVRQINEHDVLQTIFNAGPISRSQVAQQLGLNKITVSDIFNDLIDQGLIIDVGEGASSQNGGRKPTMIKFNARYGYIVSFDFGASYIDQLVTYLDGSIISYAHFSVTDMTVPDRLAFIAERIEKVDVPFAMHQLIGIAVSVPGIVDYQQIVYSPFAELVGTDIVGFLHTRFAVPVLLENGANSAAIYERDFNGAPNADTNLVAISIYQGIGAGIIINNTLYRGYRGEAGEIGNMVLYETPPAATPKTIEQSCSEDAVLSQLQAAKNNSFLARQDLVTLYRDHDADATDILDRFAFYVANIVQNVIVSFAPSRVVLNSGILAELPELLSEIQSHIHSLTGESIPVTITNDVRNAIVLGGASLVAHHILHLADRQLLFRTH